MPKKWGKLIAMRHIQTRPTLKQGQKQKAKYKQGLEQILMEHILEAEGETIRCFQIKSSVPKGRFCIIVLT